MKKRIASSEGNNGWGYCPQYICRAYVIRLIYIHSYNTLCCWN